MSYYIDYEEIRSYYLRVDNWIVLAGALLEMIDAGWDGIIEEEGMRGAAGDAIRAYLIDYHKQIIKNLKVLYEDFYNKLLLYMDSYYAEIDASGDTMLDEEGFEEYETELGKEMEKLEGWDEQVRDVLGSISDCFLAGDTGLDPLRETGIHLTDRIRELAEATAEMESNHMKDTGGPEELAESVRAFMEEGNWTWQEQKTNLEIPGVSLETVNVMNSIRGRETGMMEIPSVQQRLAEAIGRERERRLEERKERGWLQSIYGVGCIITAGVAIVATGGAALPFHILAYVAGTVSSAYGISEAMEGLDNIRLAEEGDLETASYNVIRDEVFGGNQEYYDAIGQGAVFLCEILPIGSQLGLLGTRKGPTGGIGADDVASDVRGVQGSEVPRGQSGSDFSTASSYGIDMDNLNFSNTVQNHTGRSYQDSKLLINEIIESKPPVPDPHGTNAWSWIVEGTFNDSTGYYELVIDPQSNTVWHFVFKSQ